MDEPISVERLSELVSLIYDAAIDPSRWPAATEAIRAELNARAEAPGPGPNTVSEVISRVAPPTPDGYRSLLAGLGAQGQALLELVAPHLQRAAAVNRMLGVALFAKATLSAAIDVLSIPVLLVGPDLRIIHANPNAAAMLDAGDLIRTVDGMLNVNSSGARTELAMAAERGTVGGWSTERTPLSIPLRRDTDPAGALHVLPLRSDRLATDAGAVAAIFVADIDNTQVPPTDIVTTLFGLSRAESGVFAKIAQGLSVADTARTLGIAPATVRSHLLRCFDKTGTRRQADLVHIAASLSLPFAT